MDLLSGFVGALIAAVLTLGYQAYASRAADRRKVQTDQLDAMRAAFAGYIGFHQEILRGDFMLRDLRTGKRQPFREILAFAFRDRDLADEVMAALVDVEELNDAVGRKLDNQTRGDLSRTSDASAKACTQKMRAAIEELERELGIPPIKQTPRPARAIPAAASPTDPVQARIAALDLDDGNEEGETEADDAQRKGDA